MKSMFCAVTATCPSGTECESSVVRTAPHAADDTSGYSPTLAILKLGFFANDGLMKQHVVSIRCAEACT